MQADATENALITQTLFIGTGPGKYQTESAFFGHGGEGLAMGQGSIASLF